jgi:hypothetical protein
MAHDSRQQLCIRASAELAGVLVPKSRWFN